MLFKKKSALTKALSAWLNDDTPRSDESQTLSSLLPQGVEVATEAEAKLVCSVMDKARSAARNSDEWLADSDLHSAIALMQSVDGAAARDAFARHGLPRLRMLVRERLADPESKVPHVMFALKVIGLYGEPEDVDLFVAAARAPVEPDSFWWQPALYGFTEQNPCTASLIAALANPLPVGFIKVAYLDKCNELAARGQLRSHPFASPEGVVTLEQWLTSTKDEETSYGVSACAALPFLAAPDRERLVELAAASTNVSIRIEAAWARGKLGIASGLDSLVEFARDARYSAQAVAYLKELGQEARVPPEVQAPDFLALAEMCQWLAHPHEFGRSPDAIEIADSRELHWPPTKDRRWLWIFRYRYENHGENGEAEEGYSMAGSITWAMIGMKTVDLAPEDVYGLHCAWELIQNEDREAPPETEIAAGRKILEKYNPGFGRPTLSVVGATPGTQ